VKRSDLWPAIRHEREALVSTLRTLTTEQWDAQSLCEGWTVRHVVAHLVMLDRYASFLGLRFALGLARSGLRFNKLMDTDARRYSRSRTDDDLLDALASTAQERRPVLHVHPHPAVALAELVIHGQDVRRPLGIPAAFPPAHLIATLDLLLSFGAFLAPKRPRGLRLEATDVAWARGRGRTVRAPAEELIMGLAGRRRVLDLSS
jgi:uncharacterized protein (TIGR03083 family)